MAWGRSTTTSRSSTATGPSCATPWSTTCPTRLFRLRGENKTVTATDTMDIAAVGTGSKVTYTADFTFKGAAKLVTPFLGKAFRKLGDEAEQGLREALAKL